MAGHQGIWQKQCFYQPSVQVPLMLRLPANYSETGRVSQNVSLLDILPTLLDLAEESADLPGCSLLNIARNEDNRIDRPVFAEYHHMGMLNAGFMLKRGFINCVTTLVIRPNCLISELTQQKAIIWHRGLI